MIYPSYGLILPDKIENFIEVLNALVRIHVKCDIARFDEIWVDGAKQEAIAGHPPENIPLLNYVDFIQRYETFYHEMITYIDSLQVGDKVCIEEHRGMDDGRDYPYQFVPVMQMLAGQTFTIMGVGTIFYGSVRYGNGSTRCFYLDGKADSYTWHSSMFSMIPLKEIERINIISLNINPLEL